LIREKINAFRFLWEKLGKEPLRKYEKTLCTSTDLREREVGEMAQL
jgi:hypothetical protein